MEDSSSHALLKTTTARANHLTRLQSEPPDQQGKKKNWPITIIIFFLLLYFGKC